MLKNKALYIKNGAIKNNSPIKYIFLFYSHSIVAGGFEDIS